MYPFPQSATPAVRSHLDAQVAFFNELTQTMSRSYQQMVQLNMQLGQSVIEEAASLGQRMLASGRPTEAMSAAASGAQPAADRLRAYHQQVAQLAASAQVDLTRVTEQHVQETSRTARALADEVTRASAEATSQAMRQQEEAIKNFQDPFKQGGTRGGKTASQYQGNMQSSGDGASAQPDNQAGQAGKASAQANMQASQPR